MYKYTKYAIDVLDKLVAINTVNPPGNESKLALYLQDQLENMGFSCNLVKSQDNRDSIIAVKGNPDGKKILFNGHMDTVPVSDMWKTDPFKLNIKGNRIYGRGCADMKGGIASVISSVKKLTDENFDFSKGQIILAFVADEELYNSGSKLVLEQDVVKAANFAVIAEPTSMEICIAHKGFCRFEISVLGKSQHSSNPEAGINAIYKMQKVIGEIEKYNKNLRKRTHPILPPPSAAVVTIDGGLKDNIIPDFCKIKVDRRILPTEKVQSVYDEVETILENIKFEDQEFDYRLENYLVLDAGEIDKNSPIVKISKSAFEKSLGKKPKVGPFKATSEQTLFVAKGIDTIIVGPGHIEQAHVDDEYIEIDQIENAVIFYEELIKDILKQK